ncbi:MAG: diguanylate cyclase [Trueperaceae bacterium]|nr:diguanylate cyclase [Trueperaceae bacterium]
MPTLVPDDLTGAYRREGLEPTLRHLVRESRQTSAPLSLAMVDVDHFKTLNDGFGHSVGDRVLRDVGQRLRSALRDEDLVFRYGGDEFVVLLPATSLEDAAAVLERVRGRVRDRAIDAGPEVRVHLSVGVACSDDVVSEGVPASLFDRADARLLRAKRRGRDRLVCDDGNDAPGALPHVRLLGRDAVVARIEAYLDRPREAASSAGALRLVGPAGVGFTRLLDEAATRAELRGRSVRRVNGSAAREGVHLGALDGSLVPDRLAPDRFERDATEDRVLAALRDEAEGSGLLLLVEGGERLDAASKAVLAEVAARPGSWAIEACPDGARAALPAGELAEVAPLSPRQSEAWLRALLGGSVSDQVREAAARVGAGLPGPTARWLRRGRRSGALVESPDGWSWDEDREPLDPSPDRTAYEVRVPRWETPLIGRTTLLERLRVELVQERLVVLTGPGGIGKSRLAAQLAHELAASAPGGTDWVDLRSVTRGAELVPTIARSLGLAPVTGAPALGRRLGHDRRRIVLDDADRIAGEPGAVSELLAAAPGLTLLVTSRRPLRLDAEHVVEVDGLTDRDQAATLLRRRMHRAGGATAPLDDDTEAALLDHLGGSPLAIELAAAWTRILAPPDLVAALQRRPGLLGEAPGLRSRAARTIDLTSELMSAAEREAVGTLALLDDGFEAEEARRAVDASSFLLLALLDRALLRRDGARYRMHALIAERFAAGLSDPARARQKVAAAYAALAERLDALEGDERSGAGFRRVDAELQNLRLAWAASLEPPRPERLWPLARLLRGYFDVRGRARDGLETFGAADEALASSDDAELRAWIRESVGLFELQHGRLAEARRAVEEALALLDGGPPTATEAMARNTLGIVLATEGDTAGAHAALAASASLRHALGDAVGEAQAHGNIAILAEHAGDEARARAALRESAQAYLAVDHASGRALALARLAGVERRYDDGRPAAVRAASALALADEASAVADAIGFVAGSQAAERQAALALLSAGRADEAVPRAQASYRAARRLQSGGQERASLLLRARAFTAAGQLNDARSDLERLDADPREDDRAERLLALADLALAEGRLAAAGRALGAVVALGPSDSDAERSIWQSSSLAAWEAALSGHADAEEARRSFDAGRLDGIAPASRARSERRGSDP